MEKKTIIIIVSSIILLVILISAFLFIPPKLSPETPSNCTAYNSPASPAVNIVFFASKEATAKYAETLKSSPPFDKLYNKIGISYITDYAPECEIYKGVAILCYSKQTIKQASSCPNDIIVVVREQSAKIRSSSYMNIISLNSKQSPNVFIHELAHALANIADEYVPAEIPKGSNNCVDSCEEFGEFKEGCFEGCSDDSHFRSIDKGIMRTLSTSTFGVFNEKTLRSALDSKENSPITGKAIDSQEDCSSQNYYLLKGNLTDGKIEITERTIEQGCIGSNGAGYFTYTLKDSDNEEILSDNFNPALIFTDSPDESGDLSGGPIQSDKEFYLQVPIISKAVKLEISNAEQSTSVPLSDIGRRPCA